MNEKAASRLSVVVNQAKFIAKEQENFFVGKWLFRKREREDSLF